MAQALLISADPGQPQNVQFAHFGVLDDGSQSKTSTITAIVVNLLLAFVIVVVGAATKKTIDNRQRLTELTAPPPVQKVEPIKPKVVPPQPQVKLPDVPKLEVQVRRITAPVLEKLPDVPKPIKMDEAKPILAPAPPKLVIAQAAPKIVDLSHPSAPALANNSAHPSAVALGSPNNPLPAPTAAGPSKVDLGNKGVAGMPSSNTGLGRPTSVNLAGSGSPGGANKGNGVQAVQGLAGGVVGGLGNNPHATGVNLAVAAPMPTIRQQAAAAPVQHSAPKVISKPRPEYTAEARQLHLEGTVTVHIRVLPDGSVEVVGISDGLGHGLDESARRAVQGTKFEPATDASGHPIEWDGVVKVAFQLAG
jgi:TonB family protein